MPQPVVETEPILLRLNCFTKPAALTTPRSLESTELTLRSEDSLRAVIDTARVISEFLCRNLIPIGVTVDRVQSRKEKALETVYRLRARSFLSRQGVITLEALDNLEAFIKSVPDQQV